MVHQGDILKVEKIKNPVLVVIVRIFLMRTGEIIGCPIFDYNIESPLHIEIETENRKGHVQCENLSMLDLNMRGFSVIDRISINYVMDITDTIQGIFDYI